MLAKMYVRVYGVIGEETGGGWRMADGGSGGAKGMYVLLVKREGHMGGVHLYPLSDGKRGWENLREGETCRNVHVEH